MSNPIANARRLVPLLCLTAALCCAHQTHAQGAATAARGSDQGSSESASDQKPERFEWLVGTADVGYRALDLRKIEYDDQGGSHGKIIPATTGGFSPGLGLGVRLWFVSLMLHGDVTFLSENGVFQDELELWNLDIESAFRMMQARFQPYLLLGVGYSALGGLDDVFDSHGANARLGLGFDYYFHRHMTIGFRAHIDGLLLASRVTVGDLATPEKVDTLGETKERLREADGSLMGLTYAAGLTFGVHYL